MRSIVKKSIIVYGILGLILGLGMYLYSLSSSDFTFNIGDKEIQGYKAGLISILFVPLIMAIIGAGHGVMFWFPIVYIYRKISKRII
ncbi:hypothetical protein ACP8HI_08475 [Paenibacillus sp. FA6]|uniref:hypothetical protein n=1 Tax=Paenibacillus sp. FA6 TaxID=3413029 RepID=UPI003F655078